MQKSSFIDKITSNPAGYSIAYVALAVPTYIIPWIKPGVISQAADSYAKLHGQSTGIGGVVLFWTIVQLGLFASMAFLAHKRGKKLNKGYLKAFPITACAFDLLPVLTFIPFVPSVMHILGIALGVSGDQQAQNSQQNQNIQNAQPQNINRAA